MRLDRKFIRLDEINTLLRQATKSQNPEGRRQINY